MIRPHLIPKRALLLTVAAAAGAAAGGLDARVAGQIPRQPASTVSRDAETAGFSYWAQVLRARYQVERIDVSGGSGGLTGSFFIAGDLTPGIQRDLTERDKPVEPASIARAFVAENVDVLGLESARDLRVTSTRTTGSGDTEVILHRFVGGTAYVGSEVGMRIDTGGRVRLVFGALTPVPPDATAAVDRARGRDRPSAAELRSAIEAALAGSVQAIAGVPGPAVGIVDASEAVLSSPPWVVWQVDVVIGDEPGVSRFTIDAATGRVIARRPAGEESEPGGTSRVRRFHEVGSETGTRAPSEMAAFETGSADSLGSQFESGPLAASGSVTTYRILVRTDAELQRQAITALGFPARAPREVHEVSEAELRSLLAAKLDVSVLGGVTTRRFPVGSGSAGRDDGQPPTLSIEGREAKGSFVLSSGTVGEPLPDAGDAWRWARAGRNLAPNGSRTTRLDYRLRIHHDESPSSIRCGDYEIYLSSDASGGATPHLLVYAYPGAETDGGSDDDATDDSDIYLNFRSTDGFNGQDPNQRWYVYVRDTQAGGTGSLQYIEFRVHWEAPATTPTAPAGSPDASVSPASPAQASARRELPVPAERAPDPEQTLPGAAVRDPREIRLKARRFMTPAGQARGLRAPGHYLVQFDDAPSSQHAAALRGAGATILHPVPENAVVVSIQERGDFARIPGVRWVGQLRPSDKFSPTLGLTARAGFALVDVFPDVTDERARTIVEAAGGQVVPNLFLRAHTVLVAADNNALQALARTDEVSWIHEAPDVVFSSRPFHHCPGASTDFGIVPEFVAHDDGWDGAGLGSAALTYYFTNGTADISGDLERPEVRRALAEWAKYALLSFTETGTAQLNRSVDVLWATYSHGDGAPFDGPGNVLAHCYYPAPPNSEPIGGDLHFDDSETWQIGGSLDLFSIALHELGHAVGLGHSADANAVMYPYYSYGTVYTSLRTDDINGICSIYASRPTLVWAAASSSVSEGAGSVAPTVRLTTPDGNVTAREVRVSYSTANGTAGAPGDYTSTSGTIIFPAGTASGATQTIPAPVTVVDDSSPESSETFTITLSSPVDSALGSTTVHTVTLQDNDLVTITGVTPNSGSTTGDLTVTITGSAFASPATVTFGGQSSPWVEVQSSSVIRAVTPPGGAGAVDVTVTVPGGSATLPGGFTYLAPTTGSLFDLTLSMTAVGTFQVGNTGMYSLVVGNAGPAAATGPIMLYDYLPAGLTYVSAAGSGWSCAIEAPHVECVHSGPLAPGATLPTVTIVAQIDPAALPEVTNVGFVDARGDPAPGNSRAVSVTPVTP